MSNVAIDDVMICPPIDFFLAHCFSTGLGLEFKTVRDGSNEFLAVSRFTRERKYNAVYALRRQGPAEASGKIRPGDFLLQVIVLHEFDFWLGIKSEKIT